jgi:hypothetical protein
MQKNIKIKFYFWSPWYIKQIYTSFCYFYQYFYPITLANSLKSEPLIIQYYSNT